MRRHSHLHVLREGWNGSGDTVDDVEAYKISVQAVVSEDRRVLNPSIAPRVLRNAGCEIPVSRRPTSTLAQRGVDRVELSVRPAEIDDGEHDEEQQRHDEGKFDDHRSSSHATSESTRSHSSLHAPRIPGTHAINNAPPDNAIPYGKYRLRATPGSTAPNGLTDIVEIAMATRSLPSRSRR